jgi:hypothetical protein
MANNEWMYSGRRSSNDMTIEWEWKTYFFCEGDSAWFAYGSSTLPLCSLQEASALGKVYDG